MQSKTMVYSRGVFDTKKGDQNLLSMAQTAKAWGITRVTLYQWIYLGVIVPQGHQKIGNRNFYWFSPEYVDRVKSIIPKERGSGTPILTDDVIVKLKKLKPN